VTANPLELGQPIEDIEKPEPADLRLWSVTNIIGVLDKPALLYWAAEQTALAAVRIARTLPARLEEDGTDKVVKDLRDARFTRAKGQLSDTQFGTELHQLAEEYSLTGIRPAITRETFGADLEAEWERQIEDPHGWLRDTPFYRRLAELAGADDVDVALPRTVTRPQPRGAPKVES
jgi:hypothetical protein